MEAYGNVKITKKTFVIVVFHTDDRREKATNQQSLFMSNVRVLLLFESVLFQFY